MYLIRSGAIYERDGGKETEFISPFAEELFHLDSKSWDSDAWKYRESEAGPQQGMVPRSMLWGGRGKASQPARGKFSYVFSAPDRLYYVLEMTSSCGMFYYDRVRDQEIRLFHKSEFRPRGLHVAQDYSILTTASNADGTVDIVRYDPEGKRQEALTSGDCIDENPFQRGALIYYQSSGIARNAEGVLLALGPSAINTLDTETGHVETILASETHDYLLPKVTSDGVIYCIQAPYQMLGDYPLKARLLDILLLPWRLCVAVFAFLNVFSMLFTKKPLTSAGGPQPAEMDISHRILHNRVVNLQETMRQERKRVAAPKTWKLVRYADGKFTDVASNVVWFDLDPQGEPLYTDGYSVYSAAGVKQFESKAMVSGLALGL